jgi:hypothetical protein
MPQNSQGLPADIIRNRRTTAALVPAAARHQTSTLASSPAQRRAGDGRGSLLLLCILGLLFEGILLLALPFLPGLKVANDPLQQALPGLFPWLSLFDWTTYVPQGLHWLSSVPWFDPTHPGLGNPDLQLFLLGIAFLVYLLAAWVGGRVARVHPSRVVTSLLFVLILFFALLFGVTLACIPVHFSALSQDMLAYGLYGRMVVLYHVNPYVVLPQQFGHDMLHQVATGAPVPLGTALYGPVWLDLSLLVALFAHDSIANLLLGFRGLGLIVHLINTLLIWYILARIKPERRISGTLLYAWNPVVLLLSVFVMHQEVLVILLLLLAAVFFLHNASLMAWVFGILAVLVNPFCLVVLPLFLFLCIRQSRMMRLARLIPWWLVFWLVTILMVTLAYVPYWQGMGLAGLQANLLHVFWPNTNINSLDAAVLTLPVRLPANVIWLFLPQHWTLVALALVGIFLLFSLWFANTIGLFAWCVCWIFLLLAILMPVYWPWYVLVSLALALCCARDGTVNLTVLLSLGALLGYYCWLLQPVWPGQALLTVGLPLVVWGWVLFFTSTWRRTRARGAAADKRKRGAVAV